MNCVLVFVVEQVRDFACPVHSLDGDLDHFRFIGSDDVIHGSYVATWFDLDHVPGLDLHGGYVVVCWADLIGADGAD